MTAQEQARCPGCREWEDDFDGIGIRSHVGPGYAKPCGWCSHPGGRTDEAGRMVCDYCGATVSEDADHG